MLKRSCACLNALLFNARNARHFVRFSCKVIRYGKTVYVYSTCVLWAVGARVKRLKIARSESARINERTGDCNVSYGF